MNVRFFVGTKQQYRSILKPSIEALYFCEDTHELYWGDKLLSDGLRVIPTFNDLPKVEEAAEGIVYYVTETRNGYVVSPDGTTWLQTIYAPAKDATNVPEEEIYNTVTTVGAVRDIEAKIYDYIDERIANIEFAGDNNNNDGSTDSGASGIKAIKFAGVWFEEADGVFVMDRRCAREALGLNVPKGLEDQPIEIVTKEYVDEQLAAATGADLSAYAKKTDLEGLASEEFVVSKVAEIEQAIPSVDLTQYYTKNEIDALIPETDNFATKDEIPSIEGLASETFVEEKIAAIKHPVVDLSDYTTKDEVNAVVVKKKYEVLPLAGLNVSYNDNEIRLNTEHVEFTKQNSGTNADPNAFYIGFKAYAPVNAVSFRESLDGTPALSDSTIFTFEGDFAGTDDLGRNYSIVWLKAGVYDESTSIWTNYGSKASAEKCLGYYYTVEWLNSDNNVITSDSIRIVFTNDTYHYSDVSDAVNRRFNNITQTLENNYITAAEISETYVTNQILEQNYTTTKQLATEYVTIDKLVAADYITTEEAETQIEQLVTEIVKETVTPNAINYDTF